MHKSRKDLNETMDLLDLCRQITSPGVNRLVGDKKLQMRLVCPEYSKSAQEVKTFPDLKKHRIFALCWNLSRDRTLLSAMYPADQPFCYSLTLEGDIKTQLHTHDYIELAYVVQGEFRQKILGKDITFSQGDLCLIDKNCFHQDYIGSTPAVVLFLGIANDMFSEIINENIASGKILSFLNAAILKQKDLRQYLCFHPGPSAAPELEKCLLGLLKELMDNSAGTHYIRKGLLMRIFGILSTRYEFNLSSEQQKARNWLIFQEITQYIRQHYDTVTIQELSRNFHFQEDYFNRIIKNKTGMTYSAYVKNIRLEHAQQLLLNTDMSIEDVASAVGYENRSFFYRIFQEKHHMTPSAFRKQHQP